MVQIFVITKIINLVQTILNKNLILYYLIKSNLILL